MGLRLARFAVLAAMVLNGVLLALTLAYFLRGSLEEFPTAERQEQVRVVTAVIAVGLLALEGGLFLALRWIGRAAVVRRAERSPHAV